MNTIVIIVSSGVAIYLLLKIALYLYRPFYLSRLFRDIQSKYDALLMTLNKDIESEVENLRKWKAGDAVTRRVYLEDSELQARIAKANESTIHERELYDKFIRLRERFIGNYKRLAELIVLYSRYLDMKFKQDQMASAFSRAGVSDVMTFEERFSSANEIKISIEECERKLDLLLES